MVNSPSVTSEPLPGDPAEHSISIVIPVYQGERTLPGLLEEISQFTRPLLTPNGNQFRVVEVLLVYDWGPDHSDTTIRELEKRYNFVRAVWLSRNFGQHAATLAGMASAASDWVATLDEDGQHDPAALASMIDAALASRASLVYAKPTNPPPHGRFRNGSSKLAKRVLEQFTGTRGASDFQSFRLILGNVARSVAAYSGSGVYLDVALGWVAGRVTSCPVTLRGEGDRASGYSKRKLFAHFMRMVLSSGTRGLRLIAYCGVAIAVVGVAMAIAVIVTRLAGGIAIEGWASTMVVLLLGIGAILFSLGVIAEYIGINVSMAMGRPPYLIVSDPEVGPLGRKGPGASS